MSKFTKGPWKVDDEFGQLGEITSEIGNIVIAQAQQVSQNDRNTGHAERKANALLISAAPDLYDAVKRQVENIEHWLETGIPADAKESKSIYEQLKAALRKAGGE